MCTVPPTVNLDNNPRHTTQLESPQVTAPFPRAAESQISFAVPSFAGGQERMTSTEHILNNREEKEKKKPTTDF